MFQSLLQLTKPVSFGTFSLTFPMQNVTSVTLHLLEVVYEHYVQSLILLLPVLKNNFQSQELL